MANARYGAVLQPLNRLFNRGTVAALGERALLERFVFERDEAAFEAIVTRHGPMVLGICRRGLDDPHDVEDAFQATFLVLVLKAGSLRDREQLAPWLFGVARKVTARARSRSILRRGREQNGGEALAVVVGPADGAAERGELRSALDEEIGRLPEKYRAPVIHCYLEGLTHDEAALRLRCPVGTVRSRLSWARQRLRERLDRRGLAPAGLLAGPGPLPTLAVPAALTESTVAAASGTSAITTAAGAAALAKGVTTAMFFKNLTLTASFLATAGLLTTGAAVIAHQGIGASAGVSADAPPPASAERPSLQAQNDALKNDVRTLSDEVKLLKRQLDAIQKQLDGPPRPRVGTTVGAAAPGGMSGMMGGATADTFAQTTGRLVGARSNVPMATESATMIAAVAPAGDRILAKVKSGDSWRLYRGSEGVKMVPEFGNNVLALQFTGSKIDEIAVFDRLNGAWFTRKLDPPAENLATPVVYDQWVIYFIGPRAYAFSVKTKTWDVAALKGKPIYVQSPFGGGYQDDEAIHVFDVQKGAWKRIDWEMLEKEAEKEAQDRPAPVNAGRSR